jgi:aspartate aminotransferase-like enzyme
MSSKSPKIKVLTSGTRSYIDIHPARGAALSEHLRAHGVTCSPPEPSSTDVNSIELPRGVDVKAVQALLKGWA